MKNVPSNLSKLKSKVDKLDVNKLVPVPNDFVKKNVCSCKLKNIEDNIPDITNLAINTTLNGKINEVKSEKPSITNLATTAALNAKINEVKNKIASITNLATTTALIAFANIIIAELNKLTAEYFASRLFHTNLASKNDIAIFIKKKDFDDRLENLNKKLLQIKQKMYLMKLN